MRHDSKRIISASATLLVAALALGGCDKKSDDDAKAKTADADKDKDKDKDKAKTEDKKSESKAATADAAPKDAAKPEAAAKSVDVATVLAAQPAGAGDLGTHDLAGVDASAAPALGAAAHQDPVIAEAEWLSLPGDRLECPNPKGWVKKREGNVGFLLSPDQKALLLATTYQTKEELVKDLDEVGQLAKITNVDWKQPMVVALGGDGIPTIIRAGKATVADGSEGGVLFALVETGVADKALVIALMDKGASAETQKQAELVLTSIRRARG